jgi:hypothetical protein
MSGVDSSASRFNLARQARTWSASMHLWGRRRGRRRALLRRRPLGGRRATQRTGSALRPQPGGRFGGFVAPSPRPIRGQTPIRVRLQCRLIPPARAAEALGCESVATGHYARTEPDEANDGVRLLRGLDPSKDQSYFLWGLTVAQLRRACFPVGQLLKDDVRRIAREAGLPNWDKPDSQEVCFVRAGERPADFIRREAGRQPFRRRGRRGGGDGAVLGRHGGSSPPWSKARPRGRPENPLRRRARSGRAGSVSGEGELLSRGCGCRD